MGVGSGERVANRATYGRDTDRQTDRRNRRITNNRDRGREMRRKEEEGREERWKETVGPVVAEKRERAQGVSDEPRELELEPRAQSQSQRKRKRRWWW